MRKYVWIAMLAGVALAMAGFIQTAATPQAQSSAQTAPAAPAKPAPTGYMDTPLIPGTHWHIHDDTRPRPAVITPAAARRTALRRDRPFLRQGVGHRPVGGLEG